VKEYIVIYERGDLNWSAYVPDLPGCVAAAETKHETGKLIREAIQLHIDAMVEDGEAVPEPTSEAGTVRISA